MVNTAPFFIIIFILLFLPLLASKDSSLPKNVQNAVKHAFLISLFPLILYLKTGALTTTSSWTWVNCQSFYFSISFNFDTYAVIFTPIALLVTWSILNFASWYMEGDPNFSRFFKYLLIFLIAILILITANNMFQLFIGWEGVGIISFLLISWWRGRADANTAALQAILYNRLGDIGFIFALAVAALICNSWEFQHVFNLAEKHNLTPLLIGFILAAISKSAQFGIHPWLPSAMEGPTPVSALLHSSTIVIAGVFLLIRIHPLIETSTVALTVCLCFGALTSLFAALCAINQNDIKKIIAFSTTSQLGLIIVAIGLNQPHLAFIHISTHAFFKAMLFLAAGSIIHNLNGEQDIRKIGGIFLLTPLTSSALTIGSLALTGTPFLAGFYSKDAIIEALNTSNANSLALILTLAATSLTAVYSLRLIYFVTSGPPRSNPINPINENHPSVINPIKRLIWGSIAAGFLFTSNIIPVKTPLLTIPLHFKIAALSVSILAFLIGLSLAHYANNRPNLTPKTPFYFFSALLGFFSIYFHYLVPKLALTFGQLLALALSDQTWLKKTGPKLVELTNRPFISMTDNIQQGMLKLHIYLFVLTLIIALVTLFFSN